MSLFAPQPEVPQPTSDPNATQRGGLSRVCSCGHDADYHGGYGCHAATEEREWCDCEYTRAEVENKFLTARVAELEAALRLAEQVLAQDWKAETQNFKVQHRDLADRPDLCANITDPWGGSVYPTAKALTAVREALKGGVK
jgi:hypothetical protein